MNIVKKKDKLLKDTLKDYLKSEIQVKRGLAVLNIENLYRQKMGPTVSKYTTKIYLRKNTLYIQVVSAPLKAELHQSRDNLKSILNEAIQEDLIQEVKFI